MNYWIVILQGIAFFYLYLHPETIRQPKRLRQGLWMFFFSLLLQTPLPGNQLKIMGNILSGRLSFTSILTSLAFACGSVSIFLLLLSLQDDDRERDPNEQMGEAPSHDR